MLYLFINVCVSRVKLTHFADQSGQEDGVHIRPMKVTGMEEDVIHVGRGRGVLGIASHRFHKLASLHEKIA